MNVISVTSPDINNGLGCRVTLWVAGCSHHCLGCHNPETWDYNQGKFLKDPRIIDKVYTELSKPYIQGLTISGGDPLSQPIENLYELEDFLENIKQKFPTKDIWIYAADTWEEVYKVKSSENNFKKAVLDYCDVWVDGEFILKDRDITLPFRGSTNQRIIDVQKSIKAKKPIEYKIS